MQKSQFHKTDPYDWFCGPGSHILYCIPCKMIVVCVRVCVTRLFFCGGRCLRGGRQAGANAMAAIKGISCSRVRRAAVCSCRSARSRSLGRPASVSCPAPQSPSRSRWPWVRESASHRTRASSAGASSSAGPCPTGPRPRSSWDSCW